MKNQILDYEDKAVETYTQKSFWRFKTAVGVFIIGLILSIMIARIESNLLYTILEIIAGLGIFLSFGLSIMGLIAGIKSYRRKEPPSSRRLIVLLFSSLIMANLIDLFRFSS